MPTVKPFCKNLRAEQLQREREERGQERLRAFNPNRKATELPACWSREDANGEACDLDTRFGLAQTYVVVPLPVKKSGNKRRTRR